MELNDDDRLAAIAPSRPSWRTNNPTTAHRVIHHGVDGCRRHSSIIGKLQVDTEVLPRRKAIADCSSSCLPKTRTCSPWIWVYL